MFLNCPESMATDDQTCDDMRKFVGDKDNECGLKVGSVTLLYSEFWRINRTVT